MACPNTDTSWKGLTVRDSVTRSGHHGVAPVYNHWSYMPPLLEQHRGLQERFTAPFTVIRLLTPLNMSYGVAKKRAAPYDKIVGELPQMRKETVTLIKQVVGENRLAYVLVNNRAEGNAPLTVQALVGCLGHGHEE